MPDDRFNGPRTDDFWSPTDETSATDDWPATPEPLTTSDSWASDLWATTSDPSSDIWSPPTASSDADGPADSSWGSDLWASTTQTSSESWTAEPNSAAPDSQGTDSHDSEPWVSDVWAATEPSPWVSDLWASSDPDTSPPSDLWSADETINYSDLQPPAVDGALSDVPAVDDAVADSSPAVSEPFWRSESWLLEPLSEDTQSVEVTGDVDENVATAWSDDSGADGQPVVWDSSSLAGSVATDETTDDESEAPTHEPVSWGDLGEDSEGSWNTYQRELDAPAGSSARPAARTTPTVDAPTNASQFASQRSAGPPEPPTKGFPGFMYKVSVGQIKLKPTKDEQTTRDSINDIRRSIAGLRQITFTNPKGGSGKTTAALLTSMTLGRLRGGYVLAWDNNETQGTLGVRARRDDHANTVRDLIADLPAFSGPVAGRVGDLAKYIRSQGDAMFDILASDEQAEAGEMMTAAAFQAVREVVGRFYKIICVDTGNNVRAANWAASIDSTDQLVVTASVRWESAYSASRMLDYLEQSGRGDLVSNAVTVLTMPASMKGLNVSQVETHFGVRTREVLRVPFDAQLDNGDEIPFAKLHPATRLAWLRIGAAITRGL